MGTSVWSALVVGLALVGCAAAPGRERLPARRTRSPGLARAIALGPGAVVHGLGHAYAGEARDFRDLVTLEGYGLVGGAAGYGLWRAGEDQRERDRDLLAVPLYAAGGAAGLVGGVCFLGSWIYDLLESPDAVRRKNRMWVADEEPPWPRE